jgi:3-phosphoshikimate 1-carboxyvinyltransferase
LIVEGGGIEGGRTNARRDHRLAMAFGIGALAAREPTEVTGIEWADVSFPGFTRTLERLGAGVEVGP